MSNSPMFLVKQVSGEWRLMVGYSTLTSDQHWWQTLQNCSMISSWNISGILWLTWQMVSDLCHWLRKYSNAWHSRWMEGCTPGPDYLKVIITVPQFYHMAVHHHPREAPEMSSVHINYLENVLVASETWAALGIPDPKFLSVIGTWLLSWPKSIERWTGQSHII